MKKLLSICFLSILLSLSGFVAQAQSPCCFWLENMNPQTVQDVSNVGIVPGSAALLPGTGNPLVLNNTMSPVKSVNVSEVQNEPWNLKGTAGDRTDWYAVRVKNCGDANTKVSLEWKFYNNGVLIPDDSLSNYVDLFIYTRFDEMAHTNSVNATCGHRGWLGGPITGESTCREVVSPINGLVNCHGGYPGAAVVDNTTTFTSNSFFAGGYTQLPTTINSYGGSTGYNLDYFYLPFFESSETRIALRWRQVGNYSLVVSLRERTGGTDYQIWTDAAQDAVIGGHQSCCGNIIASDSIHYLVEDEFSKEVCDGSSYIFGRPEASYSVQGEYKVVFGDSTCDHFKVEKLSYLHFFVRENPEVVVTDTLIERCYGNPLTQAELAAKAQFATPDAAGLSSKELQWSVDNGATFTTTVPTPDTNVGTYVFYVRQVNTYNNFPENADVKDTVVCEGPSKKITYIVHEIPEAPQITDPADYYCVGADAVTVADHANATKPNYQLRWSMVNTFDPEISGTALIPSTAAAGVQNFYVYQIDTVTGCFDKANYDSVVVTVYANPALQAAAAPEADCLGEEFTLTATPAGLTTYSWSENNVEFATTAVAKVTPATAGLHTYTVDVTEDHVVESTVVATCSATASVTIEVYPLPTKPVLPVTEKTYCLNELENTYTIHSTTQATATTIWFNADKDSVYTGNDYVVNINDIKPADNSFASVMFYAIAYNPTTGCYSDTVNFTFKFNKYPVVALTPASQHACPGTSATLTADITTTSTPDYMYYWEPSATMPKPIPTSMTTATATVNTNIDDCTEQYEASLYVEDANNCKSETVSAVVIVRDNVTPVLSKYVAEKTIEGCDLTSVPAPYTTIESLELGESITVNDACGKLIETITHVDASTPKSCNSILVRTYTITDNCGNDTTYTITYKVHDYVNPVISATPVKIDAVPVMDCKFNLPADSIFVNLLQGNVSDNCATPAELISSVVLTNGTSTPIASANTDIFAANDTVNIYAQISDLCGNTAQAKVAYLVKPTPMFIHHGSVSALPSEICLHDTIMLTFNVDSIDGFAHAPYSFVWNGRPNDGSIIHHTLQNAYGVPAHANDDYVYTITVTDKYGCQAKDSSESVHVWDLPTVTINPDIRNGATFPLCPNYGVLTIVADAQGNIPGDNTIAQYTWSGESVNIYSTNDTTGVYIIPDSCNHAYNAHLVVKNVKGCVAEADFPFEVLDDVAPAVVPNSTITDTTLVRQPGCKFIIPDFLPLFDNNNVVDNCYKFGTLTVSQSPAAGTVITTNTPVSIQFTDPCGNTGYYTINANIPSDNITVTSIAIDNEAFCLGGTATLTPSIANGTATPLTFAWTEGATALSAERNFTVTPTVAGVHTYTFMVTDANDCQASLNADVTVYRLPEASDITLTSTPNNYCDGVYNVNNISNGTISASALTEGFKYKLSTDTVWRAADYVYTGLHHGTYTIDLMSDHDCTTSGAANVTVDSVDVTVISTAVGTPNNRCEAPFNGTITVVNPQANYTYEIINLPNTERLYTAGDLVYESILDGDYAIHVVSDKYCPYVIYNTIVERAVVYPTLPAFDAQAQTSCVNPDGALTIHNTIVDYQYTFGTTTLIGNGADVTFDNLNGGLYSLTIKSTEGCEKQFTGIEVPTTQVYPERPVIDSIPNSVCDITLTPNGSIKVVDPIDGYTYAMGAQSYTYDAASHNEIIFTNLIDANTHVMTITSDLGCAYSYTYELPAKITFPAVPAFTKTDNTVCMGAIPSCVAVSTHPTYNGTLTITDADDTQFAYTLTSTVGSSLITPVSEHNYENLNPGFYTLSVRDLATGCIKDTVVEILDVAQPVDFANEYSATPRTSCTQTNGCINITPVENYEYFICAVQGTPLTGAPSLDAGKYVVFKYNTLTGCSRVDTVVVPDGRARYDTIQALVNVDITCDNSLVGTGSIEVTNLSSSQFTFFIDGVHNTNNVFNNLQGGSYTISVVHNETQCPGEKVIVVGEDHTDPKIIASTTPNTICTPSVYDGTITITPEADCHYVVLTSTNDTVGTGVHFDSLANGTYRIFAKNVLTGCVNSENVVVADAPVYPEVKAIATSANYSCIDTARNGSITLSSTIDDVTYYIEKGEVILSSSTPVFNGLNSGDYVFYAVSSKGCTSTLGNVAVMDSAHVYNFSMHAEPNTMCVGTFEHPGNGRIIVDSPRAQYYDYSFYDAADAEIDVNYFNPDSYTMYHLKDQLYRVVVTDTITTCSITDTITVPLKLDDITVKAVAANNDRCVAPFNGTITVSIVNPNIDGVYRFSVDGGAYQVSPVFTGLEDGSHEITVWDTTTNCIYPAGGALKVIVDKTNYKVDLVSTVKDNEFCVAPFNGQVTLAANGDVPGGIYEFEFDGGEFSANNVYTQLGAGTYPVRIKETTTGCIYEPYTVTVNTVSDNVPVVSIITEGHNNASDTSFCYDANGKLIANVLPKVASDTLGYTFNWTDDCHHVSSDSSSVNVYTHITSNFFCCTYSVEVTSIATGCKTIEQRTVCVDSMPNIKFYTEFPFTNVPQEGTVLNCENQEITIGILNPLSSLDSISWTNGHVAQNVTSFTEPAGKYVGGQRISYCVYIIDHHGCSATSFMNLDVLAVPRKTIAYAVCDSVEYTSQSGVNYKYKYIDGTPNVYTIVDTFVAANHCDSIVTYMITVNTSPELKVDATQATIEAPVCHGNPLLSDDGITAKYTEHYGWKIVSVVGSTTPVFNGADTDFDPTAPVKYADNGKQIYAYAFNGCDTLVSDIYYTLNIDSLPVVGNITSNSPYCYNSTFDLVAPSINWNNTINSGTESWQMNGTNATITNFVYSMNNAAMRYAATNACGTSYSNEITITVYNEPKVTITSNTFDADSICVGSTAIVNYTLNEGNLHKAILSDNGFSVSDNAGLYYEVTANSLEAASSTLSIVAYQEAGFVCATDTARFTFVIVDKPVVGTVANPDNICAGNPLTNLVAPTVNNNNGAIMSQGWFIDAAADGAFTTPFDPATKLYMSDNGKYLKYVVTNRCDTVYSNAVRIVVDTLPTATLQSDPTEFCAGAIMTDADFTLTGPSVTPTAPITVAPYMVLAGVNYNNDPLTMADSNKTLVYRFANRCGYNTSNAITIHVNDTASLDVNLASFADSICVGDNRSFVVTVHPSNKLTVTALDNAFTFTLNKDNSTQYTITVEGDNATLATKSAIAIKVEPYYAPCANVKFDTVKFVITDVAHFDAIAAVDAVCEGQALTLTVPTFTTPNTPVLSQEWQSNVSGSWTTFDPSTPMTRLYNGKSVRYAVETKCGIAYSDPTIITVNDTVKLALTKNGTQEICSGDAIANVEFNYTAEAINFTMNPATISGLAGSTPTTTSPDKQYIISGAAVTAGHGTYVGTVSATSTLCPATNKTATFTIMVDSTPAITFNTAEQLYCIGDVPAFKNGEVITLNSYDATDSAVVGYIKTYNPSTHTYSAWSKGLPTTITAAHDSAYVAFTATNVCAESPIYDSLLVVVRGLAIITADPVDTTVCAGSPLIDFIKTPAHVDLPTSSTTIVSTGWSIKNGVDFVPATESTIIDHNTTVRYFVETECGFTYSNPINLTVTDAPKITSAISVANMTICDGGKFTETPMTYTNNGKTTVTTWTITKVGGTSEVLDFSMPYDTSYNNAVVRYIVANECFADSVKAVAVVNNLPVPQILADTNICATGTANLSAVPAAGDAAYVSYRWFMDGNTGVTLATTASFAYTSLAEGVHTFTVEVVDANGCVSVRNDNATADKDSKLYKADRVTVNASDLPRFIFRDVNGNETHRLPDAVTSLDQNTNYTWEVSSPCIAGDQLVFVTFDFYHNGTLIENNEIGEYLMERLVNPSQPSGQKWVTSDKINWFTFDNHASNATTYYDFAYGNNSSNVNMGNHYPNTRFAGGAGADMFDDVYLHFLNQRPVEKTVAPFVQAGDYKIIYTLYYVDNTNELQDLYHNEFTNVNLKIGGRNSLGGAIHAMIVDTLKINVTGDTQEYSHVVAPEPEPEPIAVEEPNVKVYPNPNSTDVFYASIEGLEGAAVVRLVNVAGVVISEEAINPTKSNVYNYSRTTTDLTPGVYFVYVQCGDIKISKKLVVTR